MIEQHFQSTARRWGFLLTEALLIVISILLAFALDSWWDERRDRVEEQEILRGLQQEFRESREKLQYRITWHLRNLELLDLLMAAADRGSWDPGLGEIDPSFAALIVPPTTDLGNGVLDALISAGRMELIMNRELRARLAAWRGVFEEVHDDEVMSREFVFERIIPHLARHGIAMSGPMSTWPGLEWSSPRSPGDDPAVLEGLLNDPAFHTLLDLRSGFMMHTTGEYEQALQAVDEILAQIESALGQ